LKLKLSKMTKEKILGIIRHTLTFVGGVLVMRGITDESMVNELSGATITLVGGIWSIIAKRKRR